MSSEPTTRDRHLREMLVATAAAAPTGTIPRRRTIILSLIAFIAAGVFTGGALSAAALTAPAPSTTVSIDDMTRDLVRDNTKLFGTPFIITGQGDTNIILGEQPQGATDLVVAFHCLDPGTFGFEVDGRNAGTTTCDRPATGATNGGDLIPIASATAGDHRLSIQTDRSARYVLWASWAAPAPLPEPSDAQREALADGVVTEAEYRDGFARYRQCMADADYPLANVDDSGTIISYVNIGAAVWSGAEDRCYTAEFGGLDAGWQVAHESDPGTTRPTP